MALEGNLPPPLLHHTDVKFDFIQTIDNSWIVLRIFFVKLLVRHEGQSGDGRFVYNQKAKGFRSAHFGWGALTRVATSCRAGTEGKNGTCCFTIDVDEPLKFRLNGDRTVEISRRKSPTHCRVLSRRRVYGGNDCKRAYR